MTAATNQEHMGTERMGLKGDFYEVAIIWRQSSWQIRGYLALSAFLATGSIASLSETVFRWKGFVSDAVLFYQTYIAGPLEHLLRLMVVNAPSGLSNLLILTGIYLAANLRVSTFALPGARARSVALRAIADYVGVAIGISALLWRSTSLLSVAGRCAIKPRSAG
jgi:hypothetical protein